MKDKSRPDKDLSEGAERPLLSERGKAEALARAERQAEALRANLRRRKEQARRRAGSPEPER